MENILSSAAEVKNIIEGVNFKTLSRFTWLKGDNGLCKHPFGVSWDGDKELLFPLDRSRIVGDDPDAEFLLVDPPDLQPGEVCYTDAPAMYFNRPAGPGEVDDHQLAIWRARAAAAAAPETAPHAGTPQRERHRGEGGLSPLGDILKAMPEPAPELQVELPLPPPEEAVALLRVVGRELKLARLSGELYESSSFQKLNLGAQELYRIYRTYCKLAGGESLNSYIRIGEAQAAGLLERRKKDILGSSNPATRKAAKNIGVNVRSIRRNSLALQKAGWTELVDRGYPIEGNPKVNKFLVVKSEKQRLTRILEEKKKVKH